MSGSRARFVFDAKGSTPDAGESKLDMRAVVVSMLAKPPGLRIVQYVCEASNQTDEGY